eukprot:5203464-Prorocentrum_lima.AAC.1
MQCRRETFKAQDSLLTTWCALELCRVLDILPGLRVGSLHRRPEGAQPMPAALFRRGPQGRL